MCGIQAETKDPNFNKNNIVAYNAVMMYDENSDHTRKVCSEPNNKTAVWSEPNNKTAPWGVLIIFVQRMEHEPDVNTL